MEVSASEVYIRSREVYKKENLHFHFSAFFFRVIFLNLARFLHGDAKSSTCKLQRDFVVLIRTFPDKVIIFDKFSDKKGMEMKGKF